MKVLLFIFFALLFLFGLFLMGFATEVAGFESAMFIGGILAVSLSFGLPMYLLPRFD